MKNLTLLLFVGMASMAFSQSASFSVHTDNLNSNPESIGLLPWDQSSLIQIKQELNAQNEPFYSIDNVSTGIPVPFPIPNCSSLSTHPLILDQGILGTGEINSIGSELVYYDGVNSTSFDINTNGDSDPTITNVDGNVFAFADDNFGTRQLFRFDEAALAVTQVSSLQQGARVTYVSAQWGDSTYYGVETETPTTREYELLKAVWDGIMYQTSVVTSHSVPLASGATYFWVKPLVKWDRMFLIEQKLSYDIMDSIDQTIITVGGGGYEAPTFTTRYTDLMQLIDFNGHVYAYLTYQEELYKFNEHMPSDPAEVLTLDQSIPSGTLYSHTISENDKLYLIGSLPSLENEVYRFDGQNFDFIFEGFHLHPLLEDDEIIYFSDTHFGQDSSSVILLHTSWDGVEDVKIDVGEHSPAMDGALMYEDKFTFLFSELGYVSTDILQFNGLATASTDPKDEISIAFYPNPVHSNQQLKIDVNRSADYTLLNAYGQRIRSGELKVGSNSLDLLNLPAGMYMIVAENLTKRFVIAD